MKVSGDGSVLQPKCERLYTRGRFERAPRVSVILQPKIWNFIEDARRFSAGVLLSLHLIVHVVLHMILYHWGVMFSRYIHIAPLKGI